MQRIYLTVPNERAEEFESLLFSEHPKLIGLTTIRKRDFQTDFIVEIEDDEIEEKLVDLQKGFI